MHENISSPPDIEQFSTNVDALSKNIDALSKQIYSTQSGTRDEIAAMGNQLLAYAEQVKQSRSAIVDFLDDAQPDEVAKLSQASGKLKESLHLIQLTSERVDYLLSKAEGVTTLEKANQVLSSLSELSRRMSAEANKPTQDAQAMGIMTAQAVEELTSVLTFFARQVETSQQRPAAAAPERAQTNQAKRKEVTPEEIAEAHENMKGSKSRWRALIDFGLRNHKLLGEKGNTSLSEWAVKKSREVKAAETEKEAKKTDVKASEVLKVANLKYELRDILKNESLSDEQKEFVKGVILFAANMNVEGLTVDENALKQAQDFADMIRATGLSAEANNTYQRLRDFAPPKNPVLVEGLLNRISALGKKVGLISVPTQETRPIKPVDVPPQTPEPSPQASQPPNTPEKTAKKPEGGEVKQKVEARLKKILTDASKDFDKVASKATDQATHELYVKNGKAKLKPLVTETDPAKLDGALKNLGNDFVANTMMTALLVAEAEDDVEAKELLDKVRAIK